MPDAGVLLAAGLESPPPPWTVAPFALLLLAVAVLPLIHATEHWWHANRNKLLVSVLLGAVVAGYYWNATGAAGLLSMLEHALLIEYFPFITLLLTLYVIAGGIVVSGDLRATPLVNTSILACGTLIASFVGTTGASLLLIRLLLRTNSERRHVAHTVVFFIFLVSNIGGSLLPIGDPPLFLGYLRGVPFFWTMKLLEEWLLCSIALLVVYFVWDCFAWRSERSLDLSHDVARRERLRIRGWANFAWLACAVGAVAFVDPSRPLPLTSWHPPQHFREVLLLALAGLSLLTTAAPLRTLNRFSYGPIAEVACLFVGIFVTMQPALALLGSAGAALDARGWTQAVHFFWATGLLSAVLDNAPTYVVFFETATTLPIAEGRAAVTLPSGNRVDEHLLAAISCGAVFMGAVTYIGNGPNFMVKAIAEQSGVKMPSFFGYLGYSLSVLVPLFVVVTLLFFRS